MWHVTACKISVNLSFFELDQKSGAECLRAVPPGFLLLRLVGFSWGCAETLGPACGSGGCLGGAARARGLARIFAIAFGWLRWGCRGARAHPGPIVCRGWSRRVVWTRGLARVFVLSLSGLRAGLCLRAVSPG